MVVFLIISLIASTVSGMINPYGTIVEDMKCICGIGYNATLSAYYPIFESEDVSDYTDMQGKKLHSLQVNRIKRLAINNNKIRHFQQEFLDGRSTVVTAAMDRSLDLPYGTQLCIPELNQHYRRRINIEVRDTNAELDGSGTTRVEICVRSESDSYDLAVNRPISLIIEK